MQRQRHGIQRGRQTAAARPGTLTRRGVVAGALGVAGASAIGAGLARPGGGFSDLEALAALQETDNWLPEIRELTSVNGLLSLALVAKCDETRGQSAYGYALSTDPADPAHPDCNGRSPGPTLRLRRGDRLRIHLVNHLADTTNLHVHGLHVSPVNNGDNVFVHVHPNAFFDFEYQIPENHRSGLFWYHPHFHGKSKDQVAKGLAGAIIVDESEEDLAAFKDEPEAVKGVPERLLILQHLSDLDPEPFHINGAVSPDIPFRPGGWERWRIVNASSDTFLNLYLDGLPFYRVAADGNWLAEAVKAPVLPIGPAERAEALILWGAQPSYQLSGLFKKFPESERTNERVPVFAEPGTVRQPLARLVAEDAALRAAGAPAPPPTKLSQRTDLRDVPNLPERILRFQRNNGFRIDGKAFSAGRVDQTVALNSVEKWTIHSETPENVGWHPLHIHVNDFQVESISSITADPTVTSTVDPILGPGFFTDTVPLPPQGHVKILAEFLDFTGRFVYHCHFLSHEDNGMMGVIEVVHPVRIKDAAFDSPSLTVLQETTVLWTNEDGVPYVLSANDGSFRDVQLGPGQSFAYTFDVPGVVTYGCVSGDPVACPAGLQGAVEVTAVRAVDISRSGDDPAEITVHPHQITSPPITVGTTVVWINRDDAPHSVTSNDGGATFSSGPIEPGASFTHSFTTAGLFTYHVDDLPPAAVENVIDVREVRPGATVWITPDGFDPENLYIAPNSRVTWTNRSGAVQTVAADEPSSDHTALASGILDPERLDLQPDQLSRLGQRFSHIFTSAGTFPYHADPDGDGVAMFRGTVHVGDPASSLAAEGEAVASQAPAELRPHGLTTFRST